MAGMSESCSVCSRPFEVQFRYQMEEKDGGFLFFCSQECQGKSVRGETTSGVLCDACGKRFVVDLVSQVVKTKAGRKYACSDGCRSQVLAEAGGVRLAAFAQAPEAPESVPSLECADEPSEPARPAAEAPASSRSPVTAARPSAAPAAERRTIAGPRRLAIFNHKGGTGKTTTSVSIAAGLAARGLKVLLVDTDSQGNVGVSLGVKAERTLYHLLVMGLKPSAAAVNVRENLDLIVSNETLAAAELYLAGRQNRDRILKDRLASAADQYDVVLLDCSPSLSLMNQNALVYADGILVPVACDFLSLVGVRQVIKTVKNVNSLLHHPVQIYGVLPTFYDARARICRDAVDTLKEHFGDRCLEPIRSTTKIKEAPAQGRTIFEYAPDSNAAEDYMRVVDRIVFGQAAAKSAPPASVDADEPMASVG
jgi:chromosome partitioning protein